MVQGLFSRYTDPLIIGGRFMARAGPTQNISYGTCEECGESIRFCLVTMKLISGQETPVTLPGRFTFFFIFFPGVRYDSWSLRGGGGGGGKI